jgi:hypothetical protein
VSLNRGCLIEPIEKRQQQLVQAGERQVRLGLHAGRPEDLNSLLGCACGRN